jgi:hypothetical protein
LLVSCCSKGLSKSLMAKISKPVKKYFPSVNLYKRGLFVKLRN